jgi:hypothetical protein
MFPPIEELEALRGSPIVIPSVRCETSFLMPATEHLPRQARDKHRKSTKRDASAGLAQAKRGDKPHRHPYEIARSGEKNGLFEPFIYINDDFAKTGSGQT